jgi:hypothetical protein
MTRRLIFSLFFVFPSFSLTNLALSVMAKPFLMSYANVVAIMIMNGFKLIMEAVEVIISSQS